MESERRLSVANSKEIKLRFSKITRLGEGSYGVVYKMHDNIKNQIVAIKKIKLSFEDKGKKLIDDEYDDDEGIPSTTIREISILQKVKHKNLVELKEIHYSLSERSLWLIFECMDMDFRKYLDTVPENLSQYDIKRFLIQLLDGLIHLHSNGVLHRDIKPQNLLFSSASKLLKYADFGLARTIDIPLKKYTKEIETLWYRAPELMLGDSKYSFNVDVWALGCIFAEMITKKPLFMGDSQVDQIFKIFNTLGTPNEENWGGLTQLPYWKEGLPRFKAGGLEKFVPCLDVVGMDLMKKMLCLDPRKRISAKEAMTHPFLKDMI